MTKELLEKLETEISDELLKIAKSEKSLHYPITDGVVDVDRYLASSPRILWILKEPWENLGPGEGGGDWSLTQHLIPQLLSENRLQRNPTYRKMAYISFSVFNGYLGYKDIPYLYEDARVGDSLKNIAYINVSKFPGTSRSHWAAIAAYYQKYRHILNKQIAALNPDIIIAGNILHLFYNDFGLQPELLKSAGTAEFALHNSRLYINAYHPAYWRCKEERYVNDIVSIIRKNLSDSSLQKN